MLIIGCICRGLIPRAQNFWTSFILDRNHIDKESGSCLEFHKFHMMIGVTYIFPEVFCPPCKLLSKKVMIKVEMTKKRKETEVRFDFYLEPIEALI